MQGCWLAIPTRMKAATMYPDLSGLATTATLDVASIRARLRKLPDAELIRYGQNCAFLCSPKTELRKAAAGNWVVQLDEARAEWRRRHPAKSGNP